MDLWQEINYETMLWVKTCGGDGASCNEKVWVAMQKCIQKCPQTTSGYQIV
jgi:hypothetical protein